MSQSSNEQRTKEHAVKDDIKEVLKAKGVYFAMPPANGYGTMGNFDIVCSVDGAFLGIEVKRDSKAKPTQLQHENAIRAGNAGAVVLLIHKGNVPLVAATIDAMRVRMRNVRLADEFSHWPDPQILQTPDDIEPVLRRQEKRS